MIKKITTLLIITLLFSCITTSSKIENVKSIEKSPITEKNTEEDQIVVREKLSQNILESLDPYYTDYAFMVLQLISNKNWEELSFLTDSFFYENYYVDSPVDIVDYCMFMLHTGDKGVSTNYSLNEIENAFYTSFLEEEGKLTLEGLYLFPNGESEYFKILIINNSEGLIITRE